MPLCAALSLQFGCGIITWSTPPDLTVPSVAEGRLQGPNCEAVHRMEGQVARIAIGSDPGGTWRFAGGSPNFEAPIPQRVYELACVDYVARFDHALQVAVSTQDLRDPLVAGQLIVSCGRSLQCVGGPPSRKPSLEQVYRAGWVAPLTAYANPKAIATRLRAEGVSAQGIEVFMRSLDATT
ncbi:MAG: hypothetical protein KUG77_09830, partial [Nannocystaceae bacterium]|nr:hypothetical protein [Nannocystaceae bacterium]